MKRVGLVGGIGPASTLDYYSGIINEFRKITKGENYPEVIILSINMSEMLSYIEKDHWDSVILLLVKASERLSAAGADFAAMASNTPHLVFGEVSSRSPVPMISIVEETCRTVKSSLYSRPLCIGTLFTMRNRLYSEPLEKYGITSLLPSDEDQKKIHSFIFPNLENGIVVPEEKEKMIALLKNIINEKDADSVILGCTELPLMIKPGDLPVPIFNTTDIHIRSIVKHMLSE